ncbi:hypothetical protein F4776DRAFT_628375 [Hypoxylon sp. NC0597]|nr:hypothetical protein F4776DRAFT_628375 [Hypoxylon sp. NC0597]
MKIHYDEPDHFIVLSSSRSHYGVFKSEIMMDGVGLDSDGQFILDVLKRSRDDETEEGALWVRVTVGLHTKDNEDNLEFSLQLNWNASTNASRSPSQRALSHRVLSTFFGSQTQVLDTAAEALLPQAFYNAAFLPEKGHTEEPITPPQLTSNLFPFQRRALQWLLNREGVKWSGHCANGEPGLEPLPLPSPAALPLSFRRARDLDGRLVYVSDLYHVITRDITPFIMSETAIKGGILAEEMGLGKTVEMISLICMHTRQSITGSSSGEAQNPRPSGATLIVTPSTLRAQWVAEFSKHAPDLRVTVYEGLKCFAGDVDDLVTELASHDVVVTTYDVLQHEVHYAEKRPDRSMRHTPKYQRRNSPLVQISWWRVCLDEAQQIESGVSGAAKVARWIPRTNAWGVTGTPVKGKIKDLWGLLVFLRYEPFASNMALWGMLITTHKELFQPLFNRIALRHTKRAVRNELTLPPQKRYVITMPFTTVEEQHYQAQFSQLTKSLGFDERGALVDEHLDLSQQEVIDGMKRVLGGLRLSIMHPSLGPGLRRLGGKNRPLHVDEMLEIMIEQSESAIIADQRTYLLEMVKQGQLLEARPELEAAIELWQQVVGEVEILVNECRMQIEKTLEAARQAGSGEILDEAANGSPDDEDPNKSKTARQIGEYRRRLRSMLDVQHRAVFFIASAYFRLKTNRSMIAPNSKEVEMLEAKEVTNYDTAKSIRKEMLHETHIKVTSYINKLQAKAESQSYVEIPPIEFLSLHGIESGRIVDTFGLLGEAFDQQANMIDELRETVIRMLTRPLIDEEDGIDDTGEEYEDSTKLQDELMAYTLVLRALITDRQDALSGLDNTRTRHEVAVAEARAKEDEGHAPKETLALLARRHKIKQALQGISFRSIITDLRELAAKLRSDGGSDRARVELEIVERQLDSKQKQSTSQNKVVVGLIKELDTFTMALNARVEHYRQLQSISDTLVPVDPATVGDIDALTRASSYTEESRRSRVARDLPRHRYLVHLKEAGQQQEEECVICQGSFTVGVLTVCGHQFCKDCIEAWLEARHTCPVCKIFLGEGMTHEITLKKQVLKVRQEHQDNSQEHSHGPDQVGSSSKPREFGIYSEIDSRQLQAIKSIDIGAPSFATKVNTLAKHILWLRAQDPGAKSVIFSQFARFLEIVGQAFDEYRIGYSSFRQKNGIKKFKEDPAIECFIMDARAHASGLNLINASHVFLCEPLLNTALELQAIARVDRIGQIHPTTVWLYLIDGTVEESIYDLSVQRRLEHMDKDSKGKSKESAKEITDLSIEEANSMVVEQASLSKLMNKDQDLGEAVDNDDLWQCLFGHVAKKDKQHTPAADERINDPTVMAFLAAAAAEARRQGAEDGDEDGDEEEDESEDEEDEEEDVLMNE